MGDDKQEYSEEQFIGLLEFAAARWRRDGLAPHIRFSRVDDIFGRPEGTVEWAFRKQKGKMLKGIHFLIGTASDSIEPAAQVAPGETTVLLTRDGFVKVVESFQSARDEKMRKLLLTHFFGEGSEE